MLSFIQQLLLLFFSIQIANAKREDAFINNAWEMANAFNENHKLHSWVIHYDEVQKISWQRMIKHVYKHESNSNFSRFVAFNAIRSSSNYKTYLAGPRVFNLYSGQDVENLLNFFSDAPKISKTTGEIENQNVIMEDTWLVNIPAQKNQTKESTIDYVFASTSLRFDSHVFAYYFDNAEAKDDVMSVQDVYKIDKDSQKIDNVEYGLWNRRDGMQVQKENTWTRRANMKGHQLKITSKIYAPQQTYVKDGCESPECFQGYYTDALHQIQAELNFTYKIVYEDVFGKILPDKTWNGMVGLVKNNEVDFAVAPFGWRKDRLEVVDWLPMNIKSQAKIYVKNPKDAFDIWAYTKPLRTDSWIGVCIFLAIVPIIMCPLAFDWMMPNQKSFMLSDCYVHMLKSLLMIGDDNKFNHGYIKTSFFTVMVAGMLIFWLWEAMLITYFAFPTTVLPFNNIKEFVENTNLKLMVLKGSMHEAHFRTAKDPIKQRVWFERIQPFLNEPKYSTRDMCTFLDTIVEDPSYAAYIMSWGDIKRCKQYKDCKVKVIDEVLDESPGGGWTFPKKSEFRPIMFMYINMIKERGSYMRIEDHGREKGLGPEQYCEDYDGKPIGVQKVFSIFGVFLIGMITALLIFLGELILGMNNERKMDMMNLEKRCFQALFGQGANENEHISSVK